MKQALWMCTLLVVTTSACVDTDDTGEPPRRTTSSTALVRPADLDAQASAVCESSIAAEVDLFAQSGHAAPYRSLVGAFDTTVDGAVDWYLRDLAAASNASSGPIELVEAGEEIRAALAPGDRYAAVCWIEGRYDKTGTSDPIGRSVQLVLADGTKRGLFGAMRTAEPERP